MIAFLHVYFFEKLYEMEGIMRNIALEVVIIESLRA